MQDFADEIRKLKAMIVKHETRIRKLEEELARSKENADEDGPSGDGLNVNPITMASDEV